jgi:xanthine dehydrogenase YagS FAD-binding subunit
MRRFAHINATTLDEAVSALKDGNAMLIAGGTDLIGTLRNYVLPDTMYPETVVNLKSISPSLDYIKEESGTLKIGPAPDSKI